MIGQNEGLPNIEGSITSHNNSFSKGNGAFSVELVDTNSISGTNVAYFGNKAILDARKSNKVYGRSDNVTTRNLSVKYWKRIA